MKDKKNWIILLLVILLGLSFAYAFFGANGYKANKESEKFFDDVMQLQSTLSYYVGSSYSDAFGVYNKTEILSGRTEEGDKIKDNLDNLLPTLIELENTEDYKAGEKAYKLNEENAKTTLGVSIPSYEGMTFYVVEGDILKIKLDVVPEWWNDSFNGMRL